MLTNKPKPVFKSFIKSSVKTLFVAEALAFAVSYGVWYKLNSDRDFRWYMLKNYNWVLEGYYGLGEKLGDLNTREIDQKVWRHEGKI